MNKMDKDDKELSIGFGNNFAPRVNRILPDALLAKIAKLPTEFTQIDFCILQNAFSVNTEEVNISADNNIKIHTGSGVVDIPPGIEVCNENLSPGSEVTIAGFQLNHDETMQRINDWGVDDPNNTNKKLLYGVFKIKYWLKAKYASIYFVWPAFVTYFWWTTILFYKKVYSEIFLTEWSSKKKPNKTKKQNN